MQSGLRSQRGAQHKGPRCSRGIFLAGGKKANTITQTMPFGVHRYEVIELASISFGVAEGGVREALASSIDNSLLSFSCITQWPLSIPVSERRTTTGTERNVSMIGQKIGACADMPMCLEPRSNSELVPAVVHITLGLAHSCILAR